MKKIISIFTSLVLVLSMLFSFAAVEALASAPVKLYKYQENIDLADATLDLSGDANTWQYNSTFGAGSIIADGTRNFSLNAYNHADAADAKGSQYCKVQTVDGRENTVVLSKQKNGYFDINAHPTVYPTVLTSGIFEISADIMADHTTAADNWRVFHSTSANYQTMLTANYKKLTPNTWYHFTYTVDLDNDVAYESFIDVENPSDATKCFTKTTTGYTGGFLLLRAYVTMTAEQHLYIDDLKVTHMDSTSYYKSSILCIGSDASAASNPEVATGQKELSFRLDSEVPNLKTSKMVYIEDSAGKKNYAADISITSAGSDAGGDGLEDIIVTATLESEMPAWTDYTLHIDKACYKGYRYEDSGVYKTIDDDLTATFHTSTGEFAVKDPAVAMSDGEVVFDTYIINTAEPTCITAVLAIYNSKGNMVKVKPVTLPGTSFAYPGYNLIIREELASGERAKLFMINGWGGLKPLFGKMWQTTYSELNP